MGREPGVALYSLPTAMAGLRRGRSRGGIHRLCRFSSVAGPAFPAANPKRSSNRAYGIRDEDYASKAGSDGHKHRPDSILPVDDFRGDFFLLYRAVHRTGHILHSAGCLDNCQRHLLNPG